MERNGKLGKNIEEEVQDEITDDPLNDLEVDKDTEYELKKQMIENLLREKIRWLPGKNDYERLDDTKKDDRVLSKVGTIYFNGKSMPVLIPRSHISAFFKYDRLPRKGEEVHHITNDTMYDEDVDIRSRKANQDAKKCLYKNRDDGKHPFFKPLYNPQLNKWVIRQFRDPKRRCHHVGYVDTEQEVLDYIKTADPNILNSLIPPKKPLDPNSDLNRRNTSGYRGVIKKRNGTWVYSISVNSHRSWVYSFKTAEDAAIARNAKIIKLELVGIVRPSTGVHNSWEHVPIEK